jgi:hypothetical protein
MRYLLLFLLTLGSLALPALAGDPGDDFWALVEIRKENWAIDDRTTQLSQSLREGKTTVSKVKAEWKGLHTKAVDLKTRSLALENGSVPNVAKAMTKMMRLEILRLEGLIKAAEVEEQQGVAAARPFWAKQLVAYQDYKSQEALVLDMMNWIEENP